MLGIKLCFFPEKEYLAIGQRPSIGMVMMNIQPDSNHLSSPADLIMVSSSHKIISKKQNLCVDNSENLYFQIEDEFIDPLKALICKEISKCKTVADLKEFDDDDIAFTIKSTGTQMNFKNHGTDHFELTDGIYYQYISC